MTTTIWTIRIEASDGSGIWQAVGDGTEIVTDWDGTAAELATHLFGHQNVAEFHSENSHVRVRVWHGGDADTSTAPAAEMYAADLV